MWRVALVEAVTGATEAVTERYRDENMLTFPMSTHIAVAYTKGARNLHRLERLR